MIKLYPLTILVCFIVFQACNTKPVKHSEKPVQTAHTDEIVYCADTASATTGISCALLNKGKFILRAIRAKHIDSIADMVNYPLSIGYPPTIKNKAAFIKWYQPVFDSLNIALDNREFTDEEICYYLAGDVYYLGLFESENGIEHIIAKPADHESKLAAWTSTDKANLYKPLRNFDENTILCETDTELIRVDDKYRLAVWDKTSDMSNKPKYVFESKTLKFYEGSMDFIQWDFGTKDFYYGIIGRGKHLQVKVFTNGKLTSQCDCKTIR
jgi:hypothetical protein